jgi:hypothetical protein
MHNPHKMQISPPFHFAPDAATVSNVTSGATNVNEYVSNEALIYYTMSETASGAVTQIKRSFLVSDEDTLATLVDQQAEALIELFPQLSPEVVHRIASKFQSYLLYSESTSVQESISLDAPSDIEQQVQAMKSKPQKGNKILHMIGLVEERISPEND